MPWQIPAAEKVQQALNDSRLPHALLVVAQPGWGDVAFARWLALYLLELAEDLDPRTVAHPDLRWIQPDGAVIKVDAIRELAEFAIGTRQSAPCKVAVLEHAHQMNPNAANALLKTLEEPPADTYLILAASNPSRLLPTVRSRCQVVEIPPDEKLAAAWLAERCDGQDIENRLFEYASAPLVVEQALADGEESLAPVLGELAITREPGPMVTKMLALDVDRLTSRWYRYCLGIMAGDSRIPGLPSADGRQLTGFVDELTSARRQMLYTNSANARLLLERLAVRWQALFAGPRKA